MLANLALTSPKRCSTLSKYVVWSRQMFPVVDDFGYVCLDKGKRKLVNVIDGSKHNMETSHAQCPKQ